MFDFLLGLFAGNTSSRQKQKSCPQISAEQIREQAQTKIPRENPESNSKEQIDLEKLRKQLDDPYLMIDFDGKKVSGNNFYETSWNRQGYFYCTSSSGVLHLFLPDKAQSGTADEQILAEIANAEYVIVSVCDLESSKFYVEILFEDNSPAPYMLHLAKKQVNPGISSENANDTDLTCQIHVAPFGEKAAEFPLRVRFVDHLPYTKP